METTETNKPEEQQPDEQALMVLLPDTKEEIEKSGKFPIRREDLVEFVNQYNDLKVIDVNDKEGYKAMDTARKALKAKRSFITTTGKMTRDFANKYCKAVIELEKSLVEIVSPREDEFEKRLDEIDAEKDRLREEEKKKEDDRIQDMLNLLRNVGADMDIYELKAITPERFEVVLKEATEAFEKKQAEEAEQARLAEIERVAEEKRLEQERGRQEEERKRQAEEQAKINAENARLREEQRKLEEEKAKMEAEKQAMLKAKLDLRVKRLTDIGFTFTGISVLYKNGNGTVKMETLKIQSADDTEFENMVDFLVKTKGEIDKLEGDRLREEEKRREEALIEAERKRAEEEAAAKEAARLKAEQEAKEKLMQGEDADRFLYLASELDAFINDGVFGAMQSDRGKENAKSILLCLTNAREIAVKGSAKPTNGHDHA